MWVHKIGDRVQLLRVDYPFNNAVGTVVNRGHNGAGLDCKYRIDFDGMVKDGNYHEEICVVAWPRKAKEPAAAMDLAAQVAVLAGVPVPPKSMVLPAGNEERKGMPITTGVLDYFPLAIAEVAKCSYASNQQHNPGQPMHWARDKSTDHANCMARHLIDRGSIDDDGTRHSAKLAWRALANLQLELEAAQGKK